MNFYSLVLVDEGILNCVAVELVAQNIILPVPLNSRLDTRTCAENCKDLSYTLPGKEGLIVRYASRGLAVSCILCNEFYAAEIEGMEKWRRRKNCFFSYTYT